MVARQQELNTLCSALHNPSKPESRLDAGALNALLASAAQKLESEVNPPPSAASAAPESKTTAAAASTAESADTQDNSMMRRISSQGHLSDRSRNPAVLAQVISEIMNSLQARVLDTTSSSI
ncbi:hypothetical protein H9P43_003049 [Blastocladiella emersonii ATCC 22665]|nr:hypothetical protein H9P43_003049 [Blastocladiella emersonii ATCC 22665]